VYQTHTLLPKLHSQFAGWSTCLIVLAMFLIAPGLLRAPAFNLGGEGWIGVRQQDAELRLGFEAGTLMLKIMCTSLESQRELQGRYCTQMMMSVVFLGKPLIFGDVKAAKRARSKQ
jgi:hypothetical protein